jgi:hypothetical protein
MLRVDPLCGGEAAGLLGDLVARVYDLRAAAAAMDSISRYHPYVQAKPYAFYRHEVPLLCNDIVASLLHWADILVNTDGRRTDGIVVAEILQMVNCRLNEI